MRILQDGKYTLKLLARDEMLTICNPDDYVLFKDGEYLLVYLGADVATSIAEPFRNVAIAFRAFKNYVSSLHSAH